MAFFNLCSGNNPKNDKGGRGDEVIFFSASLYFFFEIAKMNLAVEVGFILVNVGR